MGMKRCKQCGMLKDETAFRQYTYAKNNGTHGRYRICRDCESINTTMRRCQDQLETFKDKDGQYTYTHSTRAQYENLVETIDNINRLYETLRSRGLQVPEIRPSDVASRQKNRVEDQVNALLEFYGHSPIVQAAEGTVEKKVVAEELPEDLRVWLDQEPQEWVNAGLSPEYLQDVVYEALKAKYRPQLGFDAERMVPIYDDTFKDALNQILRRFDDYEEECANGDSE